MCLFANAIPNTAPLIRCQAIQLTSSQPARSIRKRSKGIRPLTDKCVTNVQHWRDLVADFVAARGVRKLIIGTDETWERVVQFGAKDLRESRSLTPTPRAPCQAKTSSAALQLQSIRDLASSLPRSHVLCHSRRAGTIGRDERWIRN
jgi:hypothetical protein